MREIQAQKMFRLEHAIAVTQRQLFTAVHTEQSNVKELEERLDVLRKEYQKYHSGGTKPSKVGGYSKKITLPHCEGEYPFREMDKLPHIPHFSRWLKQRTCQIGEYIKKEMNYE